MKKRIISVMLALILVMSGIPAQVFAQDPLEGVGATEDYSGENSGLTAVTITGAGAKAVTNYAVSGSYESILDQLAEDDYEAYMHGRAKYQFMGTAAKLFPSEAEDWLAPAEFYVPATGETSTHEIRFFGDKDLDPDKLWFTTYATDTETPYNVEIISPFTEFVYGDGDGTLYIYTATISIPDREPTLDGDIALQVWYDGNNLIKSIPIHHVSNLDSLIQPYVTTYLITEYTESEEYICDTVTIEFSGFNLPSTLGSYDIGFLETTYDEEAGGPIFDRSIAEPLSLSEPDETGKRTISFRFADHDDPVQLQWVYFLIDGKMAWNFDGETDVLLDGHGNYVTTVDDENGVSVEISSPFNCLWATFGEDPEVMPEVSMPAMTRVPNLTVDMDPGSYEGGTVQVSYDKGKTWKGPQPAGSTVTLMLPGDNGLKNVTFRFKKDGLKIKKIGPIQIDLNDGKPSAPAYAGVAAVSGSTETAAASLNGTYVIYGDSDKVYRFHGKAPAAQELEVLFYDSEDAEILQRDMVWNEETLRHEADIARADFTGAVRVAMRVKENAEGITGRESGFALKQVTAGYLVVNEAPSFDGAAGTVLAPGDNVKFNFSAPAGSEWQKRVILNYKTTAGDDDTKTAAEALLEEWNSTISIPNSAASLVSMRYELYNVTNDMVTNMVEYGLSAYSVEAPVNIYAYDIPDAYEGTTLRISGTNYDKTVYLNEDVLFALDNSGYDIGEMPDGDYTWEISGASGYIASGSFTHDRGDDLDLSYDLPELGSLTVSTNGFTSSKEAPGSTASAPKYQTVNPQAKVMATLTMPDRTEHQVVGVTGQKMDQIPVDSTGTVTIEWDSQASDEISGVSPASYDVTIGEDEELTFEYKPFTMRRVKGFLWSVYTDPKGIQHGSVPWTTKVTLTQTVTRGGKTETITMTASPEAGWKNPDGNMLGGWFNFTCYDNVPTTITFKAVSYDTIVRNIEAGNQDLGQVNMTSDGEMTIVANVNYATAKSVDSNGNNYFPDREDGRTASVDSGFLNVSSIRINQEVYRAGSGAFDTDIVNGQTVITIHSGYVVPNAYYYISASGTTTISGRKLQLRSGYDVPVKADNEGNGIATFSAYIDGGEVRATVVDSDDSNYTGFLCLVKHGYTFIHEDGTEEPINHCEFVSGRGELVYPYAQATEQVVQVFTLKCRTEDVADMEEILSDKINRFIEMGQSPAYADRVKLYNIKTPPNTTVYLENAMPSSEVRSEALPPWILNYQFSLTDDIDKVRITGVISKRFADALNEDAFKFMRLEVLEGENAAPVEFIANGEESTWINGNEYARWPGTVPKNGMPVAEIYFTAELPLNVYKNDVRFRLTINHTGGKQIIDRENTVPIFTVSVPDTVSIMERLGACGLGAWTQKTHPERMNTWTLPISIRAFRSANKNENIFTVWDNGEAISTFSMADVRWSENFSVSVRLTDNLTPGVHVLWVTREYEGQTLSTEPQAFSLLSDASDQVYISDFYWTHWNSRIPSPNGGYEPDYMYFADLADMAGKTIWIWPGKRSDMQITVHNATTEDISGVSLVLTKEYTDSMRRATLGGSVKSYLDFKLVSEDPVTHSSVWELIDKDLDYFSDFEFELHYKTKYNAQGKQLTEEERRQMELKRWYEANGFGEVPDDTDIVNALSAATDQQISDTIAEGSEYLPKWLKDLEFDYTNAPDGTFTAELKNQTAKVKEYTVEMSEGDEIWVDSVWDLMQDERENGPQDPAEAGYEVHWGEFDTMQGSTLIRIATKNVKGDDGLWHLDMHETVYITASVADAIKNGTALLAQSGPTPKLNSAGSIISSASEPSGQLGNTPRMLMAPGGNNGYYFEGDKAVPDHWLKKGYDISSSIVSQADIGDSLMESAIKASAGKGKDALKTAAEDIKNSKLVPGKVGTAFNILGAADAAITVAKGPSGADPANLYYLVCSIKDEKARASLEKQIEDYENLRWDIYKQEAGLSTLTAGAGFIANANPVTKIACFVGGLANGIISGKSKDFNREVYNSTLADIQRQIQFENYMTTRKAELAQAEKDFKDMVYRRFGKDVATDPRRLAEEKKYWTLTRDEFGDLKWRLKKNVPEFTTYKDPSGYVFEGTESERLEGVTATVYYTNTLDAEGNPIDFVKWEDQNADETQRQYNPQVTSEEGRYSWMVPDGWWKVVYEKDGYKTAESKPMEVPPVHLSVNIGMLSEEAPAASVSAANGKVTVTFTKYMQMESLFPQITVIGEEGDVMYNDHSGAIDWEQNVFDVSKLRIRFRDKEDGDGSALAGTVEFVDKVANTGYKEGTYQKEEIDSDWFVKTLVFTPTDKTVNAEQVKAAFGSGIVSYAGVPLNEYAEPELITVFFEAAGGTLSKASDTVDEDGCLARLYTPTRQGFKFLGWFTDPKGGEQVTLATVFTENTTIYAHWKQLPPDEESGTWGESDQLSYRYSRKEYKVEIGGEEISESAPVFVVTFESNGRFQGLKMITDDGETANIPDGASIISLFWLDDEFAPKCDKVTIETEPEEDE